ncbi:MAG: hypothetical protein NC041_08325 [Bacteroides sp.]|nr:hypothetical protein [Prevotella sp.]MCM1408310.1 hypothetical protein [Treponema brennaborense]MCM1470458.1 hypothetical protein [Bacteroides sp.]
MKYFLLPPPGIRQNPFIYTVIIAALAAAALLVIVNALLILLRPKNNRNSSERNLLYALKETAQLLKLTDAEKRFLKNLCKQYKIAVTLQNIKDTQQIDSLFKTAYHELSAQKNKAAAQMQIALLFSIREKFEQFRLKKLQIFSSMQIPSGKIMQYTACDGTRHQLTLTSNTKDAMTLKIPQALLAPDIKPEPLSKIKLTFEAGISDIYTMHCRVLRYQRTGDNEIIISHTADIAITRQYSCKDILSSTTCIFSAVKVVNAGNEKKGKKEYLPQPKKYNGILDDISVSGCSLRTNLNIREKQYIYLKIQILKDTFFEIIGIITSNTFVADSCEFILRIKLIQMERQARNLLLAKIYGYLD